MNEEKATTRFEIVHRSPFGTTSESSLLEGLKYYLFILKDGITVGYKIADTDLEFWRTNSNMDIIAVCDIPYILSKEQADPEWKKVYQN